MRLNEEIKKSYSKSKRSTYISLLFSVLGVILPMLVIFKSFADRSNIYENIEELKNINQYKELFFDSEKRIIENKIKLLDSSRVKNHEEVIRSDFLRKELQILKQRIDSMDIILDREKIILDEIKRKN